MIYREAQATFRRVLNRAKLPKMDLLNAEGRTLAAKKKAAYTEYRAVRKDMQEVVTAKANIDVCWACLTDRKTRKWSDK